MNTDQEIDKGLQFGFIDNSQPALDSYQPALVTNQGGSVLAALEEELRSAAYFEIAVAFVTAGGLLDLKSTLADIANHGVSGRLITSTYLSFNHPDIFDDLCHIPNLEVRVLEQDGFHTKAYYFDHGDYESIIIGSANLTQNALKKNFEWNLRVTSTDRGDVICNAKAGLNDLWQKARPVTSEWIADYRRVWKRPETPAVRRPRQRQLTPNKMQQAALDALADLRVTQHATKGLVVAATGTGKTYLAAFDVQQVKPRRVLFVVHREQILRNAMASFREVLGGRESDYGILSGTQKDLHARYLFATVNMASKPEIYQQLGAEAFDYLIIDEAHRVNQRSEGERQTMYQRLMAFYKPQFLLGMTATPERTDGTNVYEYFDYNLAYEISLLDALDDDLLAPFHYIGVTDYEVDGQVIDDNSTLQHLVSEERVNYILAKTMYYGPRAGGLHGLIFVSRVEEGSELAAKFNARGVHARFVSAVDPMQAREEAVADLTAGNLQYIITVDIFNEGIDIPVLNQIVMMRPTKSGIVFLQQLGRGLRKFPGKESVTVLDFIGNYTENFMIPMAFDRSHTSNKEKIRKQVISPQISGVSTIHFEEIARKRILKAVATARLDDMKRFKTAYLNVRDKIGHRAPMLLDFAQKSSVAVPDVIKKFKTVYDFQVKLKTDKLEALSPQQYAFLLFLSKEVAVAKRPQEAWIIQQLLKRGEITTADIMTGMQALGAFCDEEVLVNVATVLDLGYFMQANREKYGNVALVIRDHDHWRLSAELADALQTAGFESYVRDVVETNLFELRRNQLLNGQRFVIGEKYYRADVLKLLSWYAEQNGQNVGGYIMRPDRRFLPVFIAVEKTDHFVNKVAYEDEFLNRFTLRWFSKSGRQTTSNTESQIIKATDFGMIQLFVKKSTNDKREGNDFYYLGAAKVTSAENTTAEDADGKVTKLVEFTLQLEQQVDLSLYRALTDNLD